MALCGGVIRRVVTGIRSQMMRSMCCRVVEVEVWRLGHWGLREVEGLFAERRVCGTEAAAWYSSAWHNSPVGCRAFSYIVLEYLCLWTTSQGVWVCGKLAIWRFPIRRTRLWNMDCLVVRVDVSLNAAYSERKQALQGQGDDVALIYLEWRYHTFVLKELEVVLERTGNVFDGSVTPNDA